MERRFLAYFAVAAVVLTGSVFALNVWVDPFARWASPDDGFDREPAYTLNRRIFKLVAFERWMKNRTGLPPSLIVGDSTANQIDAGLLSKLTGHPWYSLAYGGAGLEENAKLLDWVLENYPVRRVVWNVPFTRMVGDVPGDMARSIAMANEPIRHTLTYEALQGSLLVMRQTWLGIRFDDPTLNTGKQDAVTYNLSRTRTELAGRPWPDAELSHLAKTLELAKQKGVEVTFMNPPVHPRAQAMYDQDFPDRYARYAAFFLAYSGIDLSQPVCGHDWPEPLFHDAAHLKPEDKHLLTEALAQALEKPGELAEGPCASGGSGDAGASARVETD